MYKFRIGCLLMMLVVAFFSCREKEAEQIPIQTFFKTPESVFFRISPSGKYISHLKAFNGKQNLYVQSLAEGKGYMATGFTDNAITDYLWTADDQIVFIQEQVATDSLKIYLLDIRTLKKRVILGEQNVNYRLLNGTNKVRSDILTIALNKRDKAMFDVYQLNIKTGKLQLQFTNPGDVVQWYMDHDGKIRLATSSDGVNSVILYRANENVPFKSVLVNNFRSTVRPISFSGNKNNFYALSNLQQDKMALVEINPETGKQEKVVFNAKSTDILSAEVFLPKTRLDYVTWEDGRPRKHFFNDSLQTVFGKLQAQLGNNDIRIVDRDLSENKLIIFAYSDRNPGAYYLFELANDKLTKLGSVNSGISASELCDMKPISYKATDGLTIHGYLTLPKGKDSTNLPLVVMPHGGPWIRNVWGYNEEVQFLANRGYAVLQMNYRGSSGYGKAFRIAGFKQLGEKVQQDITDGVKWLIAKKVADPNRIAIYGAGFGGFSAIYGVSNHPELYRCAVVQHGLINFFTYLKDSPPFYKPYLSMLYEMVGNPETDAEKLRAISPVFHTDKIKAPLILFQGVKDTRTSIAELNQFVLDLRKKNVPVDYILKNDERNVFKNETNRIEMYTKIERFLSSNLVSTKH